MKTYVVHDKNRKIVSVGYVDRPELEAEEDGIPFRFGPVAEDGQTVVELYVADEFTKMPLADSIERVQAELEAKQRPPTKGK